MTRPPCLSPHDIDAVRTRFRDAVACAAPALLDDADRLLTRISPPNWALEWSLPVWLGDALGLDRDRALALVCANVLGLGYVRLQDDLADGELPGHSAAGAVSFSAVLYERWVRAYVDLLGADVAFWDWFAACVGEWAGAMQRSRASSAPPFTAWRPEAIQELAGLGAPLKVCVAATCILTGQAGRIPPLAGAVDALLVAAVMLDHAQDWEADVAAGRPNVFAAYCLREGTAESTAQVRRAIAQEWTIGAAGRPYFRLIDENLAAAARLAERENIVPLARFARWLKSASARYRRETTAAGRSWLRRTADELSLPRTGHDNPAT